MKLVTEFRCGGVCVAWSFDHLVMDGSSLWQFMCSWSEICRGLSISMPPTHDRFFEQQHEQFSSITPTSSLSYVFEEVSNGMEAKIFEFDDGTIERLKFLASGSFSAFEVVASQVWIALCKARHLPASQKTSHQLPLNCRSRLSTPLLAGYFGNCVFCALAESTAGELVTGGLPFTGAVVHEAITRSNPFSKGVTDGVDTWGGSSPRFPMYSLDFGWGKPAAVRHATKLWNGFCFYDPSPRGGKAIEVTVFLPPETMAKFSEKVKTN
ncbi:hydroxycinnamoyltransferase 1-like [Selaginella moellendorffii]|uniref:hydroxycinnamoyltransferase 1-like n=1 Tax=Selaginella moellendorffii TaxID=88036 RepID=UPI000D1C4E67|nr:hydroxycinnamoyltransferase 1-like [Selaginella moellendorffii]|eukprot:XP_024536514.1 hydroxycinnamoyltransferase 1-like [Selaginella moellendorffii]